MTDPSTGDVTIESADSSAYDYPQIASLPVRSESDDADHRIAVSSQGIIPINPEAPLLAAGVASERICHVRSVIAQQWEQVTVAIAMLAAAIADRRCTPEVDARREWLRTHVLRPCAIPATSRADVGDKYCALTVVYAYEGVHDSLAAPMILAAIDADLDRQELTADEVTGEHE